MPDLLIAFAENELIPFFSVAVHVTVVFTVLHVTVFLVAPAMDKRYLDAPDHFLKVTLAVRPLKVHFTDFNVGVAITIGVPGDTVGTVTTGEAPALDSEPPVLPSVVEVDPPTEEVGVVESEPPSTTIEDVVVVDSSVVVVASTVVVGSETTFTPADWGEFPDPAKFAAMTAQEYVPRSSTTSVSPEASMILTPSLNHA
jgi:hypothetical protein